MAWFVVRSSTINYICFINTLNNTCKTAVGDFFFPVITYCVILNLEDKESPPSTVTPVTPWISITDCYLFIGWLKVNQKKKINPFMFCGSAALHCCREWKHLLFFFNSSQSSNMFHSIREWKLEAWKCKELDNSPPKPLRYIKNVGLPVKSMFCQWRLCGGEYINATC